MLARLVPANRSPGTLIGAVNSVNESYTGDIRVGTTLSIQSPDQADILQYELNTGSGYTEKTLSEIELTDFSPGALVRARRTNLSMGNSDYTNAAQATHDALGPAGEILDDIESIDFGGMATGGSGQVIFMFVDYPTSLLAGRALYGPFETVLTVTYNHPGGPTTDEKVESGWPTGTTQGYFILLSYQGTSVSSSDVTSISVQLRVGYVDSDGIISNYASTAVLTEVGPFA